MISHYPFSPKFRALRLQAEAAALQPLEPPATSVEYTIGVDLGKTQDYSALCVIERTAPPAGEATYAVRHLRRWQLGTAYTKVAEDVAELAYRPELKWPRIAADATGVGTAVMEMVAEALRAKADNGRSVQLCPVIIGGGHAVGRTPDGSWRVAKVQLVSVLQVLLSSRRLKIASVLPEAGVLTAELKAFSVKITAGGERNVRGVA